jgi:tRNA threonylcarbamoyladenosine biosynthesis protein TsaB
MVTVLAFDCAGRGCAAAVVAGGRVLARRSEPMERGQAAALVPLIEATLAAAGLTLRAVDLLAVTVGPGAFTGVRIGLAAARGLALATGLPLVGITSFAAMAEAVPPSRRAGRTLAVALDSKRAEIFLQCFAAAGPALAPGALVAPSDADALIPPGPILVAGDAAERLMPFLAGRGERAADAELPDPADIARAALSQWRPGEKPALPRPLYLRAPDTTLPRRAAGAIR